MCSIHAGTTSPVCPVSAACARKGWADPLTHDDYLLPSLPEGSANRSQNCAKNCADAHRRWPTQLTQKPSISDAGELPVMEPVPLLQSESRVEVRLHGEHVDDDQHRQDCPERERHPLGAKRIRGQGLHGHKVGNPPTPRTVFHPPSLQGFTLRGRTPN